MYCEVCNMLHTVRTCPTTMYVCMYVCTYRYRSNNMIHTIRIVAILTYAHLQILYSGEFLQDKIFADGSKNENSLITFLRMLAHHV